MKEIESEGHGTTVSARNEYQVVDCVVVLDSAVLSPARLSSRSRPAPIHFSRPPGSHPCTSHLNHLGLDFNGQIVSPWVSSGALVGIGQVRIHLFNQTLSSHDPDRRYLQVSQQLYNQYVP